MEEIAATFAAADLPEGFARAAAEVFRRLERFKDAPDALSGEAIDAALRREQGR